MIELDHTALVNLVLSKDDIIDDLHVIIERQERLLADKSREIDWLKENVS